jgi:hypothetical protein
MNKATVPTPPQPSFSAQLRSASSAPRTAQRPAKPLAATPLDAAFLGRVARTTVWFGAYLSFFVFAVTRSSFLASSYAVGASLSALLLWSQVAYVRVLVRSKANDGAAKASRFPVWLALPLKYGALMFLIWALLRFQLIQPLAFVLGVSLSQLVIVAKVVGRMMAGQNIAEVYVKKDKNVR